MRNIPLSIQLTTVLSLISILAIGVSSLQAGDSECGTIHDWTEERWGFDKEHHSAMDLQPGSNWRMDGSHRHRNDPHMNFETGWTGAHETHTSCADE